MKRIKLNNFYEESDAEQYVPRNLMVDFERNVIDDFKSSKLSINI